MSLHAAEVIPDHYIVVFKDDVADVPGVVAQLARTSGALVHVIFRHALKGFMAYIPAGGLPCVANDPRVKYVEPDRAVHTSSSLDRHLIESPPDETHPTGPKS